jgi:hypothetical protein
MFKHKNVQILKKFKYQNCSKFSNKKVKIKNNKNQQNQQRYERENKNQRKTR